jgi:hypothetical protein
LLVLSLVAFTPAFAGGVLPGATVTLSDEPPYCEDVVDEVLAATVIRYNAVIEAFEDGCDWDGTDLTECNASHSVCITILGDGGSCQRYCDPYGNCHYVCS